MSDRIGKPPKAQGPRSLAYAVEEQENDPVSSKMEDEDLQLRLSHNLHIHTIAHAWINVHTHR